MYNVYNILMPVFYTGYHEDCHEVELMTWDIPMLFFSTGCRLADNGG